MAQANRPSSLVQALMAAAAAIPTLDGTPCLAAEDGEKNTELRFSYMSYEDWQEPGDDRITIHAPMAWFRSSLSEKYQVEGSAVLDSVSGASPLYHDTLSGASGRGIEDERRAIDLSVTRLFEQSSVTAGISSSSEDDYDALGGTVELRYWTKDKNTVIQLGISGSDDDVGSTNDPHLDEQKKSFGIGFGITQILDKVSALQSNITYANADGYLTDPYKTFDNRPRSRDQVAWLTRYVQYIPSQDSSVHLDYRLFGDSWGVFSHTFELAYYQPLGERWLIRPRIRYYFQEKADFYSNDFPPDEFADEFYTADQRLSGFGSLGGGLRIERKITEDATVHITCDYLYQEGGLKALSPGSPNLEPFSSLILGGGFYIRF